MAIKFTVREDSNVVFRLSEKTIRFGIEDVKVITPGVVPYEGDYTANCKLVQQTFPTKDKRMTDDFKVNAIRVAETINPQGGNTVFIGL